MSEGAHEADFTCPFCGRQIDTQQQLADHFEGSHGMDDFGLE